MSTPTITEVPLDTSSVSAESSVSGDLAATTETVALDEEAHAEGGLAVLGIDTPFLIAQVINFLLLLIILRWLLYRPILAVLNKRRTTIEESLNHAAAAAEAAKNSATETRQQLDAAREQAKQIVDEAKTQAETIAVSLKQQATEEATALLERTRTQLEQEKMAVLASAEQQLGDLVLLATEKVLVGQKVQLSSDDVTAAIKSVKGQSQILSDRQGAEG